MGHRPWVRLHTGRVHRMLRKLRGCCERPQRDTKHETNKLWVGHFRFIRIYANTWHKNFQTLDSLDLFSQYRGRGSGLTHSLIAVMFLHWWWFAPRTCRHVEAASPPSPGASPTVRQFDRADVWCGDVGPGALSFCLEMQFLILDSSLIKVNASNILWFPSIFTDWASTVSKLQYRPKSLRFFM